MKSAVAVKRDELRVTAVTYYLSLITNFFSLITFHSL